MDLKYYDDCFSFQIYFLHISGEARNVQKVNLKGILEFESFSSFSIFLQCGLRPHCRKMENDEKDSE